MVAPRSIATPKSLQRFRRAICRIECKESTALHRRAGGRHLERVLGNCVAPDARATTSIFREAYKDERYGSARTSPVQPIPRRPAGVSGMQEIAPCDAPAPTRWALARPRLPEPFGLVTRTQSERVHLVAGRSDIGGSIRQLRLRHRQRVEGFAQQLDLTSLCHQIPSEQMMDRSPGRSGACVRHILGERLLRRLDEDSGLRSVAGRPWWAP